MTRRFFFVVALAVATACSRTPENNEGASRERYTCSMHPQIVQESPGTCPICGMALVKVATAAGSGNRITLNAQQIRLADITTQKVTRKHIGEPLIANGVLSANPEKSHVISSRAPGRIEKLFVKETGHAIRKGRDLYTLYSDELLALEREYLLMRDQSRKAVDTDAWYKSLADAARRKLLLYGLSDKQVEQLSTNALQPYITFAAPASGTVTAIEVSEGQYVQEGTPLFRTEDLTSLWVEAELYGGEAALVKEGDRVLVRTGGVDPLILEATADFISPEYRANTQVIILRAKLRNPSNQLRPGQEVQVIVESGAATALALPSNAVIRSGRGAHVYVQTGPGAFEPHSVKTGREGPYLTEITAGLTEGDTVVITGAYLLYSEMVLKKGTNPMAEHLH